MSHASPGRFREQVRYLRRQFLQYDELPCSKVLSEPIIVQSLSTIETCWLDRIDSALVTLWVFLSQVLAANSLSFPDQHGAGDEVEIFESGA